MYSSITQTIKSPISSTKAARFIPIVFLRFCTNFSPPLCTLCVFCMYIHYIMYFYDFHWFFIGFAPYILHPVQRRFGYYFCWITSFILFLFWFYPISSIFPIWCFLYIYKYFSQIKYNITFVKTFLCILIFLVK